MWHVKSWGRAQEGKAREEIEKDGQEESTVVSSLASRSRKAYSLS